MAGQPPGPLRNPLALALGATVFLCPALMAACGGGGHQRPDDDFNTSKTSARAVRGDAVKASGTYRPARILFDHAHYNWHRIDGRYRPFARLATDAGFEISATSRRFDASTLRNADVIVIANATPEPGASDADTFLDSEIDAIEDFVNHGGGLLLITDVPPWALPPAKLAARFGVRLSGGVVWDRMHMNPILPIPQNLFFAREDGLLANHPILDGATPADRVDAVATFSGQALFAPPHATPLLPFGPTARHTPIRTTYEISRYGTDVMTVKGKPERLTGGAQAAALQHGAGRVVVMGEAAALTAQVVDGGLRFGMNLDGADNAKFAINTLRWLSRR
jgi:hypothetical protein